MAKAVTRSTTKAARAARGATNSTADKQRGAGNDKAATDKNIAERDRSNEIEHPISEEKQDKTIAQERREENQGMRVDGTTPRHTEPLGIPAPGQGGRPSPERRVTPGNQGGGERELPSVTKEKLEKRGKKFRVTATRMGYLDHVRRREGDVFDVYEDQFSERWMETVDGSTPVKVTTAPQALKQSHDEKLLARATSGKRSTGDASPLGDED